MLERNAQRYPKLRVSLAVSGMWLEQAERWDADLLKRLKRLVHNGNVELIAVPYDNSMAAFYDLAEFAAQVAELQKKLEQVFGEKSAALAVPGLCYNNRLAHWAEKAGFKVMAAGDASSALDWRTCNKLYEAKGGEGLRVAFANPHLSRMLMQAESGATVQVAEETTIEPLEPEITETRRAKTTTAADFVRAMNQQTTETVRHSVATKKVRQKTLFSARKFLKQLDLAFLRGDLVSLQLTPEIFGRWRELGIIGFFDELFKLWLEAPSNQLCGVQEMLKIAPAAEVSVKTTISMQGDAKAAYQIPAWWTPAEDKMQKSLYALRSKILRTEDRNLYVDFTKLTALEYASGGEQYCEIMQDLQKRLAKFVVKMPNGEELVTGRGMTASTAVEVKIDHQAREIREKREKFYEQFKLASSLDGENPDWDDNMDDMEAAIQVFAQRMKQASIETERDLTSLAEAELVDDNMGFEAADIDEMDEADLGEDLEPEPKAPKPKSKKRFKKIVIE